MTEKQTEKNKQVEFEEKHREQMKIVALFGTIEFDPDYDYKKQRQLDRTIFPQEEK
ncbi:MAG: hypothetical protein KAS73_10040 [Candidatus Sabulitectum sp.]|nr:hypothetical protein [Candidatus Sabulitectum sp.]